MKNNIIVINGPNLNLLGEREQSQYGKVTFDQLEKNCLEKAKKLKFVSANQELFTNIICIPFT